jgi:peptidoglycan hydrolase-like protein with peptidoglycan-binding domain
MNVEPAARSTRAFGVVLGIAAMLGAACTSGSDGVDIPGVNSPQTGTTQVAGATSTATTPNAAQTPSATSLEPTEATSSSDSSSTVESTSPPPPESAAAAPTTTVAVVYYRQGDEGPEVGVMQLKLITLGYLAQGSASSVFDAATEAALRQFQTDYALGVDGVFGPLTNRSLTAAANSVDLEPG